MKTWALSREKLSKIMVQRGFSLSRLAKESGVSRQSLYNLFLGRSLFSVPFQKILDFLETDWRTLLEEREVRANPLSRAPSSIQKVALQLSQFARERGACLLLFGSRMTGGTLKSDWDFGLFFDTDSEEKDRRLRILKQKCIEMAFPYRMDGVNLNRAPAWLREGVLQNYRVLEGTFDKKRFSDLGKEAA